MIRALAAISIALAWLCLGTAACFAPTYDHPACSSQGDCPGGLTCVEPAHMCEPTVAIDAADRTDASNGGDAAPIDAALRCQSPDVQSPSDPHRCFRLIMGSMQWQPSRDLCVVSNGGDLADIRSSEENATVATLIGSTEVWLGGDDMTVEGTWVWTSGAPFSYTQWANGEPNGGPTDDCLRFRPSAGGWADALCTGVAAALCVVPAH